MPTLLELQNERLTAVTAGRAIHKTATDAKRDMTAEESTNFDKYMADSDAILVKMKPFQDAEKRTQRLADAEAELKASGGRRTDPTDPDADADKKKSNVFKFEKRDANNPISTHEVLLDSGKKKYGPMATPEAREHFRSFLATGGHTDELRDLQSDIDTQGGFLGTPQEFAAKMIAVVDNQVFIRQRATVITLNKSASLGVPSRDVDTEDSDWTSELATGNPATALSFGKRELKAHPLAKQIKISKTLIRNAAVDIEGYVKSRLAYKFGITQEKAFLLGDGIQKPLGVFTPTTNGSGISTARDIVTGSATNFTADGLINAKYFLKSAYWPAARFLFHRFAIQRIRQLKDSNGQYLWVPSGLGQGNLSQDSNDRILEFPFDVSEYCPNTFTTGLYVGILADWSNYWIADSLDLQLQRLEELYATTNQVGFIARAEMDGAPVLEEPFVRIINS